MAKKLSDFQREAAQSLQAGQPAPSGDPFGIPDWVAYYRDMKAGKSAELDFNDLKPDERQFLENLKTDCDRIPAPERERMEKMVMQFLSGEISWAEYDCYPPELMYDIARMGQSFLELNKLEDAKTIFEGLAILDHKNYHYRGMLGSIAQRMKDYVTAIAEYSMAIELNPSDLPSHTNRGECFLRVGLETEALRDFEKAMELGADKVDRWANRARILHKNIRDKAKKKTV